VKKAELQFRNILNVLDPDFSEFVLQYDYKLLETDGITRINSFEFQKDYWNKPVDEVTANPNANMGNSGERRKSFYNLVSEMITPVNKLSALTLIRKYGNRKNSNGDRLVDSIINGNLYAHNLSVFQTVYCVGLSLYPLVTEGLTFGDLPSNPPHRPTSFVNQVIRYVQFASTAFAGATALTDFFAHYSYYTSLFPDYTDKQREQDIQNLVHGVNDPTVRIGFQSPFTNVSILSPETMRFMFANYLWGDKQIGDIMDEVMRNQRVYAKFFSAGQLGDDRKPVGIPYRFPITTLVADPSFAREYPEVWEEIVKNNSNLCYLNILSNMQTDLRSIALCCRLNSGIEELLKLSDIHINNTFGSYLQIGSHQVVSINLPRIAYETKGETKFLELLRERCQLARELLLIHREEILQKRRIKYHFFFKKGLLDLKRNFFSTLGFIGLPNALEILGMKITEPSGMEFAKKVLKTIKDESVRYTKEDGYMYNVEEVPAESAAGTLAVKDKMLVDGKYDYYDSQFVPLSYDLDLMERIALEGELQEFCTGGSISHLNIDGKPDSGAIYDLTNKILTQSKLRHFAFNVGFTVCANGHVSAGIHKKCPNCLSEEVDFITRVVGYFTPVSLWNKAKKVEFSKRKWKNV
jgi:ribonucleoside-triphosphate reductase